MSEKDESLKNKRHLRQVPLLLSKGLSILPQLIHKPCYSINESL